MMSVKLCVMSHHKSCNLDVPLQNYWRRSIPVASGLQTTDHLAQWLYFPYCNLQFGTTLCLTAAHSTGETRRSYWRWAAASDVFWKAMVESALYVSWKMWLVKLHDLWMQSPRKLIKYMYIYVYIIGAGLFHVHTETNMTKHKQT